MRVLDADQAVQTLPDGVCVAISGNGSILQPDRLLAAVERAFASSGHPRDLGLYYPVVIGTRSGNGIDHLAHPGLVSEVVASCFDIWGVDRLATMIRENRIVAHCLPMGIMFQLLHAAADGQPGILSRVGLHTFVDPEVRGTSQNAMCTSSLARRTNVDGEPFLYYVAPRIGAALIRGSVSDEDGNISLCQEPISQGVLAMALAARAGGGKVLVQVKGLVRRGTLPASEVVVPGCLVDVVSVIPDQWQTVAGEYDGRLTGAWSPPMPHPQVPLDLDTVMARRAALELRPGMIVNLGFGIATRVAAIAAESGVTGDLTFSVEHGPLGGMPAGTNIFGAAIGPTAILRSTDVFGLYHTGLLDLAILSAAEVDAEGNANVSRFAEQMPGPGGYIDITGPTRRLVLLSALRAGGLRWEVHPEGPRLLREGTIPRFVSAVRERTFSGRAAWSRGAQVLYLTDRCTFELCAEGLLLTEIAPGMDLRADILDQMEFAPQIARQIRIWPSDLFRPGALDLRSHWQEVGMASANACSHGDC